MANRSRELSLWRIRRALHSLGWTGALGLIALAFSIGYFFAVSAPLRTQIETSREELAALNAQNADVEGKSEPATLKHQLDEFYLRLASQEEVAEVVRQLHRHATAVELRFVRGDYRPQRDANGKILRYQITLPLRGGYPKVREFLARSLESEEALALDNIGFQKDDKRGGLETRVQFTLFVRSAD